MADQAKKLQVDVVARIDKLEKAMRKAAQISDTNMGKVEGRARTMVVRVDEKLASIGKSFAIGVGGGVLAAMAPLALFQKAVDDIGKAAGLQRLADRIGLSTTSLQALQFGATQAGVAVDQMGDGLGDFAAKVAEASAGAGPLAEIFKQNGVELKKQDGTLRSTRDVLGDFADLIKNAQTPAEQLFLAQQAFGDEAAKMVPLFKDGARGLEQLEVNAKAAGATIDADLVKRAEELDRRMQSMWQTFSARSASAVLTAVEAMDGLLAKLHDYEQRKAAADLGTLAGSLVQPKGSVLTPGKSDRPTGLDARMAGTLDAALSDTDKKLVEALQARYGEAAAKATVIPVSGSGGGAKGSSGGLKEKLDLAERVIENLRQERSLIGLTGVELEKQNALWAAGKDASAAQRQEISRLVEAIYSANEAWEAQQDALEEARDAAREFTGDLINGLLEGKDASEVLSNALKRVGSQLISSGLDGLFSGSGGFLSSLFGGGKSFNPTPGGFAQMLGIPGYASGTNFHPGGMAIVGERGPELLNLPRGAQVMPRIPQITSGGGGGTSVVVHFAPVIDNRGASVEAVERTQRQLDKLKAEIPGRVVDAVRNAQKSNVKLR